MLKRLIASIFMLCLVQCSSDDKSASEKKSAHSFNLQSALGTYNLQSIRIVSPMTGSVEYTSTSTGHSMTLSTERGLSKAVSQGVSTYEGGGVTLTVQCTGTSNLVEYFTLSTWNQDITSNRNEKNVIDSSLAVQDIQETKDDTFPYACSITSTADSVKRAFYPPNKFTFGVDDDGTQTIKRSASLSSDQSSNSLNTVVNMFTVDFNYSK